MKSILIPILLLFTATVYSSQKAITDTGEEVILNGDGSWLYSGNDQKANETIKTNKQSFIPGVINSLIQWGMVKSRYFLNCFQAT